MPNPELSAQIEALARAVFSQLGGKDFDARLLASTACREIGGHAAKELAKKYSAYDLLCLASAVMKTRDDEIHQAIEDVLASGVVRDAAIERVSQVLFQIRGVAHNFAAPRQAGATA